MSCWDFAVAGGGLAGAAAACHLAQARGRVILYEREPRPHHKVCGEFVSIGAHRHLELIAERPSECLLSSFGAAPINHVRLVCGRFKARAPLPFPAWGLSRLRLDTWLLERAERRGAVVRRGEAVQSISADEYGVRLRAKSGPIAAGTALLATGKHELHGLRRNRSSDLIAFKLHFRLSPEQGRALYRHIELVLFDGGYAGLQHIENGVVNLCLVVKKERFTALGRDWRRLLASVPHLVQRLDGSAACWPRPLAISRMPYGYIYRERTGLELYRLGDQFAVIASFTGDGMAIALHSAKLAADAILAGQPPAAFHAEAARMFRRPVRLAGLLASFGSCLLAQAALAAVCSVVPGLMTAIASHTRAPPRDKLPGA